MYTNSQDLIWFKILITKFSWFARVNSRLTLPYKIEWQTSGTYSANNTAQGRI
jgi:hypothetical protein